MLGAWHGKGIGAAQHDGEGTVVTPVAAGHSLAVEHGDGEGAVVYPCLSRCKSIGEWAWFFDGEGAVVTSFSPGG